MRKSKIELLGVSVEKITKENILEKIVKHIKHPEDHFHIVSLNPEIFVLSEKDKSFRDYLNWAHIRIIDGIGVIYALKIRGQEHQSRITGVDLMEDMLNYAASAGLRVALIGGKGNVAKKLAECQNQLHPGLKIVGMEGIADISNPKLEEENEIFSIVADLKPHMLFAAFGSPAQELWLCRHKDRLKGIICMGVGGSIDFLAGKTSRAPVLIRKIGMEWLYRLMSQPWRFIRQLRIITFIFLVVKEWIMKR